MGRKTWLLGMVLGLLAISLGAREGFCAGFALFEEGARATALGGAFVGRADDPSAIFYNPAGITQLPGLQVLGGATLITIGTDVVTHASGQTQRTSMDSPVNFPPHFYATYQCSDRIWAGLGVFTPFGLSTRFSETWPGRYNNYNAEVQSVTTNPTVAVKITDSLSLAAGLDVTWLGVHLDKKGPTAAGDVDEKLEGDSFGAGFNVGLRYKPFNWLALGASYRSQQTEGVSGNIDFVKPARLPSSYFNNTHVYGTVTLPNMVFLGATFYPTDRLSWEVGGVWTQWSQFERLGFKFRDDPVPGVDHTNSERNWHDTWRMQTGVEYKTTDWLDLRAGYVFDQEAIPSNTVDYILPLNNRHIISFGPGFHFGKWNVDFSYSYLIIMDRTVAARPQEGILNSEFRGGDAHLVGLSVGYKFDL